MNHVQNRYFPNPWRPFCDRWWGHWFNLMALWRDIRDASQRAKRGWADCDIFDLMSYHAGVTLGLLKHFRENHSGYIDGMTPEEYDAKIDISIDGWQAKWDYLNEIGWDCEKQSHEEWSRPLLERWENGHAVFVEIYDSLWN